MAAAATAANGLQLGLEGFYFRKGRLLVIMDVNLEVIASYMKQLDVNAPKVSLLRQKFESGEFNLWIVMPQVVASGSLLLLGFMQQ